ncbi:MAG: hypothetical protein HKN24_01310 [Acidimicrobiales bacterium]|nr:hypothetical protein [Acidimicrobiales bacterium]
MAVPEPKTKKADNAEKVPSETGSDVGDDNRDLAELIEDPAHRHDDNGSKRNEPQSS